MIYVIAIAVVVIVVGVVLFAYEFVTAPYLCDMCGRPSETALCYECRAEYERIMGVDDGRARVEPQPELDALGCWWYEGEPYFDNDQMESHLFHDVFGNSEIDVDMKPVLDGGVWYWERDDGEK